MNNQTEQEHQFRVAVERANTDLANRFSVNRLPRIDVIAKFGMPPVPGWQASYLIGPFPPTIHLYDAISPLQDLAIHEVAHAFHDTLSEKLYKNTSLEALRDHYRIDDERPWMDPDVKELYECIKIIPADISKLLAFSQGHAKALIPIEFFSYATEYTIREEQGNTNRLSRHTLNEVVGTDLADMERTSAAQLEQLLHTIENQGTITYDQLKTMCKMNTSLFDALNQISQTSYDFARIAAKISITSTADIKPDIRLIIGLPDNPQNPEMSLTTYLETNADRTEQIERHWRMLSLYLNETPAQLEAYVQQIIPANATKDIRDVITVLGGSPQPSR